jgi:hypothetical protein
MTNHTPVINKPSAIVVIGAGHHARRIYIPELISSPLLQDAKIIIVDIFAASPQINKYIATRGYADRIDTYYIHDKDVFETSDQARQILEEYNLIGVIISTDPTHHVEYAKWALQNNLHILMDKPVSTHDKVVEERDAPKMILHDYQDLMDDYEKSTSMFCLSTQRRYETGYQFVYDKLAEVSDRFNMPVTSIQASHSDGLWIFPDEIIHQRMHPYNTGYGKLSHSGFHILDIVWQLYLHGTPASKMPDEFDTFASAVYPQGLMQNITAKDYENLFGSHTTQYDDDHYQSAMKHFGEIDVVGNITVKKNATPVGLLSVNLLHSSFSKRSWQVPSEDLYKGNGRVKHQTYMIEQGPFQCIQIHNYQATDDHDTDNDSNPYELGGKNHFDIYIFRNSKMFSDDEPTLQKFSSADLDKIYSASSSKLSNELAKNILVTEFITNCFAILSGDKTRDTVSKRNCITTYEVATKMMSAMYQSLVLQKYNEHPVIRHTT